MSGLKKNGITNTREGAKLFGMPVLKFAPILLSKCYRVLTKWYYVESFRRKYSLVYIVIYLFSITI